jgi:hypothetical protein
VASGDGGGGGEATGVLPLVDPDVLLVDMAYLTCLGDGEGGGGLTEKVEPTRAVGPAAPEAMASRGKGAPSIEGVRPSPARVTICEVGTNTYACYQLCHTCASNATSSGAMGGKAGLRKRATMKQGYTVRGQPQCKLRHTLMHQTMNGQDLSPAAFKWLGATSQPSPSMLYLLWLAGPPCLPGSQTGAPEGPWGLGCGREPLTSCSESVRLAPTQGCSQCLASTSEVVRAVGCCDMTRTDPS